MTDINPDEVNPDDEAQTTPEPEQPHGSLEDRVAALESIHADELDKLHAQQGAPVADDDSGEADAANP